MILKKEGKHLIKFSADFLLFFSLLYLILNIICTVFGVKIPAAPYTSDNPSILVFSYSLSFLSLAASFLGLESVNETVPFKYYRMTGFLLVLLSLACMIFILIKMHFFDLFALVTLICGILYIIGANK